MSILKEEDNKQRIAAYAEQHFETERLCTMTEKVNARCNWTQTAGSALSELVPTRLSDEDVFVKPELDDVVNEERAALFANKDCQGEAPCELQIQISPRFKIAALTLVCSAPKVELFIGSAQEYLETVYGIAIDEDEDEIPIKPYRYDVEIDRSGIAEINLRLLTATQEICIYGAMLHIAPNPNGITTQLQNPFDLQKIQELLQVKPEDNEQKMQKFMSLMQGFSHSAQSEIKTTATANTKSDSLTQHIEARFEQLERAVFKRLDEFENQQSQKLDKIIAMLENRN